MATSLGYVEVSEHPDDPRHRRYAGRLVIPTLAADGHVVGISFRCIEDHKCDGHGKYDNYPGVPSRPYNLPVLRQDVDTIHITEGQLDCASLAACGLAAVGLPGASAWPDHRWRLFQGFERIMFWADADDKGQSLGLFARIRQRLRHAELVHLPPGHDVNSLLASQGREAVLSQVPSYHSCNPEIEDLPEEVEDDREPPYQYPSVPGGRREATGTPLVRL